mgnify:FL=1
MRFILGGSDTEMIEIESLLADTNYSVIHAKVGRTRVNRSEAYSATHPAPKPFDVWIECSPEGYTKPELYSLGIDLIDHHQEGDFGYNMPPAKYWEASSIGQLCKKLGIRKTKRLSYIAAGDHCLLSAYHDKCPGISRNDFIDFRMKFYKFEEDPFTYLKQLHEQALSCPTITMGQTRIYDISSLVGSNRKWLSDMACCFNLKTVSVLQKKNRYKMFVSNLSASQIDYFINEYAPSLGNVINTYGDPRRQFAGAVLEGQYVRQD